MSFISLCITLAKKVIKISTIAISIVIFWADFVVYVQTVIGNHISNAMFGLMNYFVVRLSSIFSKLSRHKSTKRVNRCLCVCCPNLFIFIFLFFIFFFWRNFISSEFSTPNTFWINAEWFNLLFTYFYRTNLGWPLNPMSMTRNTRLRAKLCSFFSRWIWFVYFCRLLVNQFAFYSQSNLVLLLLLQIAFFSFGSFCQLSIFWYVCTAHVELCVRIKHQMLIDCFIFENSSSLKGYQTTALRKLLDMFGAHLSAVLVMFCVQFANRNLCYIFVAVVFGDLYRKRLSFAWVYEIFFGPTRRDRIFLN